MPRGIYLRTKKHRENYGNIMRGKHWKCKKGTKNRSKAMLGNQNTLKKHWKWNKEKLINRKTRKITFSNLEKEKIKKLYLKKKMTFQMIAKIFNLSITPIRKEIKKQEINRTQSKARILAFKIGRAKLDILKNLRYQYKFDLGHSVLNNWEANICRFLKLLKIKYQYESKMFRMKIWNKITWYRPDIYLPDFDLWIEVKGWKKSFSMLKIKKFSKTHIILVIDGKIYRAIKEIFKDKIKNWEK